MVDPVISSSQSASGNTTNLTNTSLTTDFNVVPYYDDYDPNRQYYRILFKPGYAVQARELTQIQSMLQNQIYRLGRHVFKEGSIVLPGAFTLKTNRGSQKGNPIDYIKINTVDNSNNTVDVSGFVGETITGNTSNITAYVVDVADSDGTSANTKTLYVTYLSASSVNSSQRIFAAGETLYSANAGYCVVKNNDAIANTGYASWFQIEEGVYFAKEHFIYFPTQSIILDRYNPNPNCQVGFYVTEELISSEEDSSLLDPALESSNYQAPGADRLKLLSTLSVVDLNANTDIADFVPLFTIKDGVIQTNNEKSQYNILGDELAKRTFDESGDYVISGLNIQIREHDDITTPVPNYGRYANGNNQLLVVSVDPGYAYVHGYAVNNFDKVEIDITKPTEYNNVESQILSTSMGQTIRVNEVVGSWEMNQNNRIYFYDTVHKRISGNGNTIAARWSTTAPTGNNIGSGIVHYIQYISGTPGYDALYDVYINDISMTGSNSVSNIRSVFVEGSTSSNIGADVYGASNTSSNTTLSGLNQSTLLYYVGSSTVRTVKDSTGLPDITYYYSKTDKSQSMLSTGILTYTPSLPTHDSLPYGTGTVSSTDILDDIMVVSEASFNIGPLFSSATVSASGNAIARVSGTTYFTRLNVGDKIEISGLANTYHIASITDNNNLTLTTAVPASVTGNTIFKAYKKGDIHNLTGKGIDAGTSRTVTATPTTLTIDLKETLGATRAVTITSKIASTQSAAKNKTLKPNRVVLINCATAGTSGPFCLGFSDVYQIRKVILKTGSAPTTLSDGANVTSYFTLDNGQRDTLYDLGYIIKSPNYTLSGTDYLLVELDYFEPSTSGKAGFYNIDSYSIQDNDSLSSNTTIRTENIPVFTSPVTQQSYDLRNYIDFRPVKKITATDTTTIASATTNPSSNSTMYNYDLSYGTKIAIPSTEMTYDYSYYLGRKDIVVVNKSGTFSVVSGVSSDYPIAPDALETQMLLGIIDIKPYPSLSPAYANALERKDMASSSKKVSNRRYTMRDIGVLDDRIRNLEYYTSLTLLEKDALNMKILDDAGNDRFKNGIFIDTFKDTSLSAAGVDPDYRIVTDPIELAIRPLYSTESIGYNEISVSGVVTKNGVAILDYTDEVYLTQTNVTDYRNIERGNYLFRGSLDIFPAQDVWVDTSFTPDETINIISTEGLLSITGGSQDTTPQVISKSLNNTVWEGWKTQVTGYNLYRGEGSSKTLVGQYSTEAAAAAAAAGWMSQGTSATVETLYVNSRKGTNYFSNQITDTAAGSNKLISSTVIPYIRPQTVYVKSRNLKPYSKVNAFFDGVNVSEYCTPLTEAQYTAFVTISTNNIVTSLSGEGDDLIVGNDGYLYFSFRIPQGKFRTGERKLVVLDGEQVDPTNITSEQDASTLASGIFFASGTNQVLQRTIYSTKGFSITPEDVYENTTSQSESVLSNAWTPTTETNTWTASDGVGGGGTGEPGQCVGYSVYVKVPKDEEGMFCTGFDFYLQRKSETRGLWVEIREMNNAGDVIKTTVPGSIKRYTNSEIVVSPDGISSPMEVRFDSPVFLFNNKDYAFIIHSDNPPGSKVDPDTTIWISRLGEKDINTEEMYNTRSYRGTFFYSTNNRKWNVIPDVDMPITVYRANFTSTSGTIVLGNKPIERLLLKNVSSSLSNRIGDVFKTGDSITITGSNVSGSIIVTDKMTGNIGFANSNVLSISGSTYVLSNTGYSSGELVNIYNSSGTYRGSATITSVSNSSAVLAHYDESSTNVYADFIASNGNLSANSLIRSIISGGYGYRATIDAILNQKYDAVSFEPKVLDFMKSGISYEMKTTANSDMTLGSYENIIPSETTYMGNEKVLLSKSNETSGASNQLRVTLSSSSKYVSPVFDLDSSHTIFINNIINANTLGEDSTTGGHAINKYISQVITLADGQDAEDINVYLTAYRPPGTDVLVYGKFLNGNDTQTISQKSWTLLEKSGDGDSVYSSLANRNNYKEFTYTIPAANKNAVTGIYNYTSNSTVYNGYKYFAIKIVLTSTNSAIVPRVADLRCIALQL